MADHCQNLFESATFCWLTDPRRCILPIRNQGGTNSCYAFAVVDTIYAMLILYDRHVPNEKCKGSEQEFLDYLHMKYLPLDAKRDNEGKLTINEDGIGNTLSNAFEYMQHYGLTFESKLKFHGKCKLRTEYDPPKGSRIFIDGYHILSPQDPQTVIKTLTCHPIPITIICPPSFQEWKPRTGNEIYSGPNEKEWNAFFKAKSHMPPLKSPYEYHALVIIGHGVEGNIKYYIAKNSWGDEWGYKGFVKIAMDIKAPFYESMLYPSQPYLKQ